MLSGGETETQQEKKEVKVHPDVEVSQEEVLYTRLLQEPTTTSETQEVEIDEGEELEEGEVATESNLNSHKEERGGISTVKEELRPLEEESHGLQSWFGFFSPGREAGDERKVSDDDEIPVGDSWQHRGGNGVMDGANVHSPTETEMLRDDEPTEIDEKTFFNVRYEGKDTEEVTVATSQVIFDFNR